MFLDNHSHEGTPRSKYQFVMLLIFFLVISLSGCDDFFDDEPDYVEPYVPSGNTSNSSNNLPLKPVGFVNNGIFDATVRAASYIPLGSETPQSPPTASTVSTSMYSPGGSWPNSSRFISVPLGTYTWCIDWEEDDQDGDGYFDYYHYYTQETTLLDYEDSDELDYSQEVAISAPPITETTYRGKCNDDDLDTDSVATGLTPEEAANFGTHTYDETVQGDWRILDEYVFTITFSSGSVSIDDGNGLITATRIDRNTYVFEVSSDNYRIFTFNQNGFTLFLKDPTDEITMEYTKQN